MQPSKLNEEPGAFTGKFQPEIPGQSVVQRKNQTLRRQVRTAKLISTTFLLYVDE